METITRYCAAEIFRATRIDPAEYCEEEAAEGSEYCEGHDPDNYDGPDEPDWDDDPFEYDRF